MSIAPSPPRTSFELDAAVAGAAGAMNLANARLTQLVAEAIEHSTWSGVSPKQWIVHGLGTTPSRADVVLAVAERRELFPVIIGRFDAGELSLEQVYELTKAPPAADAKLEDWAEVATPHRIRLSVKRRWGAVTGSGDDTPSSEPATEPAAPEPAEPDWVTTSIDDQHRLRLRGSFDLETGQILDAALIQAREELFAAGERQIGQADCLRHIAQRFLDGIDSPTRRDRSRVWIHIEAVGGEALTDTGVRVPDAVRDKITCDGIVQPVWETGGVPFNLGRAQHIVPERVRRAIILRDQGCRAPDCHHDRFLDIHHIIHWIDGGPTESWNLVALCPKHHRLHHQGRLGISGNADRPGELIFTDEHGRRIEPCGAPLPPAELPEVRYRGPLMGRVDWDFVGLSWPDG
ncbi:MAG: HNH endonuclease [Ilumatobacter sp.]|nr:HNH endonuclease [Ilumatobacter sp.]